MGRKVVSAVAGGAGRGGARRRLSTRQRLTTNHSWHSPGLCGRQPTMVGRHTRHAHHHHCQPLTVLAAALDYLGLLPLAGNQWGGKYYLTSPSASRSRG
ncbi:hypothetical protein Pcinc_017848 [Petrolisthes cinctipes]|uniref:Uncharacterized protein n=1 Tax=Petrolisthes cinctipes TaxID=88211 RepID=A0AAE1ELV6_PETCI|nr:hypothetical protein Pcinc_039451 [Petrolisthes cinctipes]KAK3877439.1 hypothetical protein Pcinc_017848 [Petrolisthes cinctipes]